MYAVVGCDECQALWIVEGRPATSQCPRCGKTRGYGKRRKFVRTEDEDHAREVRSSMLAARQGHDDAFADLETFAELEEQIDDAGIDDETYLASSGLDAEEIEDAGIQADRSGDDKSKEEIVREALREIEDPTETDIVEYAKRRDVPASYTERALEKLTRSGDVTESRGIYRHL